MPQNVMHMIKSLYNVSNYWPNINPLWLILIVYTRFKKPLIGIYQIYKIYVIWKFLQIQFLTSVVEKYLEP